MNHAPETPHIEAMWHVDNREELDAEDSAGRHLTILPRIVKVSGWAGTTVATMTIRGAVVRKDGTLSRHDREQIYREGSSGDWGVRDTREVPAWALPYLERGLASIREASISSTEEQS